MAISIRCMRVCARVCTRLSLSPLQTHSTPLSLSHHLSQSIWVKAEKCIELIERRIVHGVEDFDDFDGVIGCHDDEKIDPRRKRPPPPVGTTAHELYQRQLPRWAKEDEAKRMARLAMRAFLAVPFREKCEHIRTQVELYRGQVVVQQCVLKGDLQLEDVKIGNKKLFACIEEVKKARDSLKRLSEKLEVVEADAKKKEEEGEGDDGDGEESSGSSQLERLQKQAAREAMLRDAGATITTITDVDGNQHIIKAAAANKRKPHESAVDVSDGVDDVEQLDDAAKMRLQRVVELKEEHAEALRMAESCDETDKAIAWHCENAKEEVRTKMRHDFNEMRANGEANVSGVRSS